MTIVSIYDLFLFWSIAAVHKKASTGKEIQRPGLSQQTAIDFRTFSCVA